MQREERGLDLMGIQIHGGVEQRLPQVLNTLAACPGEGMGEKFRLMVGDVPHGLGIRAASPWAREATRLAWLNWGNIQKQAGFCGKDAGCVAPVFLRAYSRVLS